MMSTRFFLFTMPIRRSRARRRIDSSWLPRHSITRSLGIEESVHKGGEGRGGEGREGRQGPKWHVTGLVSNNPQQCID